MKFYYNNNSNIEHIHPRHWLDKEYWTVWSTIPDTVAIHGEYCFKWTHTLENVSEPDPWTYNAKHKIVEKLVIITWFKKINEESWQDDIHTRNKMHSYKRENEAWLNMLLADLELAQKERRRNITREQNQVLKEEAKKLNLTVKDLKEKQKKERLLKNPFKTTKLDIERTTRMIQVGPALKDLKDQIDFIFEKANKNSKKLMPKTIDRSIKKIEVVTRLLETWINNSQND